MWGAAWLRRATGEGAYKDYIQNNAKTLGAEDNINEFGWDNKHAGLNVLVSKVSLLSLSFYFYFFYPSLISAQKCFLIFRLIFLMV